VVGLGRGPKPYFDEDDLSGVATTTIYRRWRDNWELALDAVMIDMLPRFADPVDVGDTRKELVTFLDSVVKQLAAPPMGPAIQALVSQIATEPELARVYREQVVEPRRAQPRQCATCRFRRSARPRRCSPTPSRNTAGWTKSSSIAPSRTR
jgi:hypothetical protein